MSIASKWSDLLPRTLSAIVMATVGITATYYGGVAFSVLILVCLAAMLWELLRMARPAIREGRDWGIFFAYSLAITVASCAFIYLRNRPDGVWAIFVLFVIVILSDIFGYFAGKAIGGPKFWPRISPKKTWAGTIAGWVAAGIFGVIASTMDITKDIVLVSASPVLTVIGFVLLAFAAQLGDIVESALKRRYSIKDSSNLIPGHGGVLDRFDGMVGVGAVAGLFIVISSYFGG
ncbi:phosphatidate cytidylyltransferase [Falsihalocynthiibacter sp. SS001]|uniref:phosphatidate cytidylyltransferase n=1 Tax=Falsihalocynthiibacter sp. SS001 TaxID=3349698 RepID=UPI0036D24ED0